MADGAAATINGQGDVVALRRVVCGGDGPDHNQSSSVDKMCCKQQSYAASQAACEGRPCPRPIISSRSHVAMAGHKLAPLDVGVLADVLLHLLQDQGSESTIAPAALYHGTLLIEKARPQLHVPSA